jgi:hypothetical protein
MDAAQERVNWMEAAKQHCRNEEFYRAILDECAVYLKPEVYVSDDGSVQDEPVRLKIPELIGQKIREAVGCTYAAMCTYAMNGKDITKVEFPEIAEGVMKALGIPHD